ncbi:alpha/beta hydrolase [Brevibacterium permense]|uniref:alpha/beta hydrolase n=1 Tax=Brevibacterium permense TaxID=234834 RepID=UPI0021CFDE98|nr:alpha/beta hydrolase [Brevibacterium permense]MCU4298219.1 alpha/beta hydrolase [Brevibacterium permense]
MHFTTEQHLDDDIVERRFRLGDIPGILWTPAIADAADPVPIILMGQPGGIGMERMYPRLAARARCSAAHGFASACLEAPGSGDRLPIPGMDQARNQLRSAVFAGEKPSTDVIDALILPLVDRAVPEWQSALDEFLRLPEIADRVGFSGGVIAIATRLTAIDSRISAAGLFAGSFIPRSTLEEARQVTNPLHVLLQWDDEGNDREASLELFDAFASKEKTLYANMGGHTGVPEFAGDDAARFFARHLTMR